MMFISEKKKRWMGLVLVVGMTMASVSTVSVTFPSRALAQHNHAGMLETYYNPSHTLAQNVNETLEISSDSTSSNMVSVRVTDQPFYIDNTGLRIDPYNRTTPYYQISREWKLKNETCIQKELLIEGKKVVIAFADAVSSYQNDPVIEKMVRKQIEYELGSQAQWKNQDHKAFINELINKGMIVIESVKKPQEFTYTSWVRGKGEMLGRKPITEYDKKEKIQSIFNQKVYLNNSSNGGQEKQLGSSFKMSEGQILAIDINQTSDKMPTVNWSIKDVTTGKIIDRFVNAESGYRYIYTPSAESSNHVFKVTMSGEISDWAEAEIFTYAR
ncbi:hypothetical protein [Paenibacillus sp. Z6-24]